METRIDMDDGTADRDAHEDGHVYGAHESSWGALRIACVWFVPACVAIYGVVKIAEAFK